MSAFLRRDNTFLAVIALWMAVSAVASATTLTWDGDDTVGGLQDGGGIWDTSSTDRWWTGANYQFWNNANNDSAVFGVTNGTAGQVLLLSPITVQNITFNPASTGTYVIKQSNSGRELTLAGNSVITANADATIFGTIFATSGFVKAGPATLTLDGTSSYPNLYPGDTIVDAGTLVLAKSSATISIPGNLTINANATVRLASREQITNTAVVTINSGTFDIGANAETAYQIILLGGNIFGTTGVLTNMLSHDFDFRGGTVTANLAGPAGMAKTTPALLVWGGTNSYLGDTILGDGAVILSNNAAIPVGATKGNLQLNAVLDLNGNSTAVNALSGSGTVTNSAVTPVVLTVDSNSVSSTFDGLIVDGSAPTGLTKVGNGTLVLTADQAFSGPFVLAGGVVDLTGAAGLEKAALINITAATLAVTNRPDGTLALSAGQTLTGNGTIAGALVVTNSATVAPGTALGPLTIEGAVTLGANSTTILQLNKSANTNGSIRSLSGITLGGTLVVTNVGGLQFGAEVYPLFSAPVLQGTFDTVILPVLPPGLSWTNKLAINGTIAIVGFLPTPIRTSFQSGNWDSPATWGGFAPPVATNIVTINAGNIVTNNAGGQGCSNLTVIGSLRLNSGTFGVVDGTLVTNGGLLLLTDVNPKTFGGPVTIAAGGTWFEAISAAVNFGDNLRNDGTFTANGGAHTFTGAASAFRGTNAIVIPNVTINAPGNYVNRHTLTIVSALGGSGSLAQETNSVLNLSGTITISNLTATASSNTVNYTGAGQLMKVTTYYHLGLSGSGGKNPGSQPFTVLGNLAMTGTATLQLGADLTIGGQLMIGSGNRLDPSCNNIQVSGGVTVDGELAFGCSIGNKSFAGNVTVHPGGKWNNTDTSVALAGNVQNDGNFAAGTGTYTCNGTNRQVISNSVPVVFRNLVISNSAGVAINGTVSVSGLCTVSPNALLLGTGVLNGPLQVRGTLAPGNSIGTLALNQNPSLLGAVLMEINRSAVPNSDNLQVNSNAVTYASTLVVTNLGTMPANGDIFPLFTATNYSGSFSNLVLPALPSGLVWNNRLALDGTLGVITTNQLTPPGFSSPVVNSNGNFRLTFSGFAGQGYRLWAGTNVALLPVTNFWTVVTNGVFTGGLDSFTDASVTNYPRRFYLLTAP